MCRVWAGAVERVGRAVASVDGRRVSARSARRALNPMPLLMYIRGTLAPVGIIVLVLRKFWLIFNESIKIIEIIFYFYDCDIERLSNILFIVF